MTTTHPLSLFVRPAASRPAPGGVAEHVRGLIDAHWQGLGRMLRHLGTPEADLEDALQGVFMVAAQKLAQIRPGAERAFLAQTAVHMAARARRSLGRRREVDGGDDPARPDPGLLPDAILEQRRALNKLDQILAALPFDLHAVFVLYEIEELTMAEIAEALDLPPGTVASRLRRARLQISELANAPAQVSHE